MEKQLLVECRGLYPGIGGTPVVGPLDFCIHEGDYLCVVGENGAGKSTLLKTLLGLLPPVNGAVSIEQGLRKEGIGYMPQFQLVDRDFPATVSEVVYSGCRFPRLWPFVTKQIKQKAALYMEKANILDLAGKCFRNLSGGQRQRVLLARALCVSEKLIVMDEPTASLDASARQAFYALTDRLNQQGTAIVMVTHDIYPIKQHASHILHLARKSVFTSPDSYLNSDIGRLFVGNREGGND